jgi:hypothetical protein
MMHRTSTTAPELLQAIVRRLDRGGSPDAHFPDREGEYWALCPFHPDRHPNNFSVSEAGYHCFACGASGGLWPLAEKLGVAPRREASHGGRVAGGVASQPSQRDEGPPPGAPRGDASRTGGMAGRVEPLHRCSVVRRDNTPC